ncbi:MAG: cadherin repeat domain-containing protein [Candidatus Thiodiazotropha endolucinida]
MAIGVIWSDIWNEDIWNNNIWAQAAGGNQPPVINDQTFYVVINPGSNLISNGTFDVDLSDWINETGHWSHESGRAYHASSGSFNQLRQDITVDFDSIYRLSLNYEAVSGALRSSWRNASDVFIEYAFANLSGTGNYIANYIIPANTGILSFSGQVSTSFDGYIDNVELLPICSVVIGTVHAEDPDEDPLTYSIIAGNTDNDITIDSNTAVLSWANAPDPDRTASYDLTVQVDDGTDTASATVTVNVIEQAAQGEYGLIRPLIRDIIQPLIRSLVR